MGLVFLEAIISVKEERVFRKVLRPITGTLHKRIPGEVVFKVHTLDTCMLITRIKVVC